MLRTTLLERIETVAPALAAQPIIPVLQYLWFTGDRVMAHNDQIAISAPLRTDFVGAIPGTTLIELLKASRAKDIEFEPSDDNLLIKAASSRMTLPTLSESDFIFNMPNHHEGDRSMFKSSVVGAAFVELIEGLSRSLGNNPEKPETTGITIIPEGKRLHMYSTNDDTLSYAHIDVTNPPRDRCILSSMFCRQLVALAKNADRFNLLIADNHSMAYVDDVELYGALVESDHPMDFDFIMDNNFPAYKEPQRRDLFALPSKVQLMIDRAVIATASKDDPGKTIISVKEGKMRFRSETDRAKVEDTVLIDNHHKEVTVRCDPKMIRTGLEDATEFKVTKNCIVLAGGRVVFLVSVA